MRAGAIRTSVAEMADRETVCRALVRGRVQGVGFRWWAGAEMRRLGLTGGATNLDDGSVEVVMRGDADAIGVLLTALRGPGTPGRVVSVEIDPLGRA